MDKNKILLKVTKKVGSIAELARRLGVSRGHMNNIIKGTRAIPPKMVRELVFLSENKITEEELRPDIFYNPENKKKQNKNLKSNKLKTKS